MSELDQATLTSDAETQVASYVDMEPGVAFERATCTISCFSWMTLVLNCTYKFGLVQTSSVQCSTTLFSKADQG